MGDFPGCAIGGGEGTLTITADTESFATGLVEGFVKGFVEALIKDGVECLV